MASLPVTFANLTNPTLPELDQNFAALGALTTIPCAVAGTSALSLTPKPNTPTVNSYVNYQGFAYITAATNAGAVTAQVGALPFLNVYKDTAAGPLPLSGGETIAGALTTLFYDSLLNSGAGGFHLQIAVIPTPPVIGTARGLTGLAGGSGATASWTVQEIIAETALGGSTIKGVSLTLPFDGSTTGAGGMDTGAVPTSGSLSVYAIYNPTTGVWAALGQSSGSSRPTPVYSGANAPLGFSFSVLIWTGVTDGSAHIRKFQQQDRMVWVGQTQIVSATAGTVNTYVTANVSPAAPAGAVTVSGTVGSSSTSAASQVTVASDTSGSYSQPVVTGASGVALDGFGSAAPFMALPLTTVQQIAWKAGTNTVNTTINVDRYTF